MAYEVVFAPEARDDLLQLYDYIAARSGPARARAYTERILSYCLGFETSPSAAGVETIFALACVW